MTPVTGAIAYNELASLGLSTVAPHLANNVDLQSSHLVIAYCFELHRSCVRHVRRRNGGLGRPEEISCSSECSSVAGDDDLCGHTAANDAARDAAPR